MKLMLRNEISPTDEFISKLADRANKRNKNYFLSKGNNVEDFVNEVYTKNKEGEERFYFDNGNPIYLPNDGVVGKVKQIELSPGSVILTRYGEPSGRFVSPKGVPFEMRALPRTTVLDKTNLHGYKVIKPIMVEEGVVAPWFMQKGLGIQYKLPDKISNLADFLEEIDINEH